MDLDVDEVSLSVGHGSENLWVLALHLLKMFDPLGEHLKESSLRCACAVRNWRQTSKCGTYRFNCFN